MKEKNTDVKKQMTDEEESHLRATTWIIDENKTELSLLKKQRRIADEQFRKLELTCSEHFDSHIQKPKCFDQIDTRILNLSRQIKCLEESLIPLEERHAKINELSLLCRLEFLQCSVSNRILESDENMKNKDLLVHFADGVSASIKYNSAGEIYDCEILTYSDTLQRRDSLFYPSTRQYREVFDLERPLKSFRTKQEEEAFYRIPQ